MTLPLRFPRFWLALGWTFVVLAFAVCLAPSGTAGLPHFNDKVMHAFGYFALTVWFAGVYPRTRYFLIVILLFAMGVAVEILQGAMQVGRDADPFDVAANSSGIAVGIVLSWAFLGGWMQWIERRVVRRA